MEYLLNYAWIGNKDYYCSEKFRSRSPIPAEFLNNVDQVAQKLSDITIWIWCDDAELTRRGKEVLLAFKQRHPNLHLKNLNNVPTYRENPVFEKIQKEPQAVKIWHKVDLLRLLVLAHVFKTTDVTWAFYSDFDVADPEIHSQRTRLILDKHSLLLNNSCVTPEETFIENNFMGFHRAISDEITQRFIPETVASFSRNKFSGWDAFWKCALEFCAIKKISVGDISFYHPSIRTKGRHKFDTQLLVIGQKPVISCAEVLRHMLSKRKTTNSQSCRV